MSDAPTPVKLKYRLYPGWSPYFFIAPFVGVFLVFMTYPLIYSIPLALQQTNGPKDTVWVGFQNFIFLFDDPEFWKAMKNTVIYAAASMFIQLPMSLGLAMLLNRPDVKFRAFWRMIFFAPSLVGLAFVAILARLIFQKGEGLLNSFLEDATKDLNWTIHWITGQNLGWVFNPEFDWLAEYVMPALILASLWLYVGFNMVYFLAALQAIDPSLVEAAKVDGAGAFSRFWHITLPSIRPIGTFVALLSLIGSFQLFELPYLLLNNSGGPDNRGLTVVMYLYQQGFEQGDLGYASAIGWVLALLLMGFALSQRIIGRSGTD